MNKPIAAKVLSSGWGARLTQARKFLKKTQADIGELLGVLNTAVSKWEGEAVPIGESSLSSLEFKLGINPAWVRRGDPPMIVASWNEDMRLVLTQQTGMPADGVWLVPEGTGMEPHVRPGDVIDWVKADKDKLEKGELYLVAPRGLKFEGGTVAPAGCKIGMARPVKDSPGEWLLYRLEDIESNGSYPPLALRDFQLIGRAITFRRCFPRNMGLPQH